MHPPRLLHALSQDAPLAPSTQVASPEYHDTVALGVGVIPQLCVGVPVVDTDGVDVVVGTGVLVPVEVGVFDTSMQGHKRWSPEGACPPHWAA